MAGETVTLQAQWPGGQISWAMTSPTAGQEILDLVLHEGNVTLRMWRPGLGELTITDESCLRALLTPGFSRRQRGTVIAWGDRYDRSGAAWSVAVLRDQGSDFWVASDDTCTDGTSEADLLEAVVVRPDEASAVSWAVLPLRAGP